MGWRLGLGAEREVYCRGWELQEMRNENIVKPESKSPIPCPNRPQILTLIQCQTMSEKTKNPILWTGLTQ